MKQHLKRNFTPKTWPLKKKENTFSMRPKPGGQALELGLPLGIVLRDVLSQVKTFKEAKKVMNLSEVLVDGKKRKDPRFLIGLFDVLSLPKVKEHYRLVLNKKGKLSFIAIEEKESKIKIAKIVGKKALKKNQIQLNLSDGKNILSKEKVKVGDSVVISLPENKIMQVLELKPKAYIYLMRGRRAGSSGLLKELAGEKAVYEAGKDKIETLKDYIIAVGEEKPLIKLEK